MPDGTTEDLENPPIVVEKKQKMFQLDPAFPVTMLSAIMTGGITHLMVYGVTGKAKVGSICALVTFPFTWGLSLYDAEQDFIKWKKTKALRDRGVAEKFMPYKVKYDWTDYESKMQINPDRVNFDD